MVTNEQFVYAMNLWQSCKWKVKTLDTLLAWNRVCNLSNIGVIIKDREGEKEPSLG